MVWSPRVAAILRMVRCWLSRMSKISMCTGAGWRGRTQVSGRSARRGPRLPSAELTCRDQIPTSLLREATAMCERCFGLSLNCSSSFARPNPRLGTDALCATLEVPGGDPHLVIRSKVGEERPGTMSNLGV